jgi:hypothetical protein
VRALSSKTPMPQVLAVAAQAFRCKIMAFKFQSLMRRSNLA